MSDLIGEWVNQIHHGDARDLPMDSETVHLVVTSPPYNLDVDYLDYDDSQSERAYRCLLADAFAEIYRVLISGGRLAVVVGLGAGVPCDDKPRIVTDAAQGAGFELRDKFVWDKGASESTSAWGSWRSPSNPRQIYQHEEILVFYKDHPGRRDKSRQSIQKNDFLDFIKSVWTINPETSQTSPHPAAFPRAIPRRIIKLYSFPDDIVIDPFSGSGTTCRVAKDLNRRFAGVELSKDYVAMAQERTGVTVDSPERLLDGDETSLTAFADGSGGES